MITLLCRESLVGSFFLLVLWICHTTPFWPIKFLLKNLLIVLWVSFICNKCFCSVFLAAFKILSLCLTFNILIILCLGVEFFEFIFFGTLLASRVWMSVLFHKFQPLFLQINFLVLSLFSFWGPYNVNLIPFDIVP